MNYTCQPIRLADNEHWKTGCRDEVHNTISNEQRAPRCRTLALVHTVCGQQDSWCGWYVMSDMAFVTCGGLLHVGACPGSRDQLRHWTTSQEDSPQSPQLKLLRHARACKRNLSGWNGLALARGTKFDSPRELRPSPHSEGVDISNVDISCILL